jgi:hypothetical protein
MVREIGDGMTEQDVDRIRKAIDPEELAKEVRDAWARYAADTLPKCPPAFSKSWDETGEWGREGNRVVARVVLERVLKEVARADS